MEVGYGRPWEEKSNWIVSGSGRDLYFGMLIFGNYHNSFIRLDILGAGKISRPKQRK
jgi:hypothetical protein